MEKQTISRSARSRSEFVLLPSRLRMALIYLVLFGLALLFGLFLRVAFSGWKLSALGVFGDWYITLLIVVVAAIAYAFIDYRRWTIRVLNGEQVDGPTGGLGERITISLRDLDHKRTLRSLSSRIRIGNAIYTKDRQRILITPWFYPPMRFKEFLNEIGLG